MKDLWVAFSYIKWNADKLKRIKSEYRAIDSFYAGLRNRRNLTHTMSNVMSMRDFDQTEMTMSSESGPKERSSTELQPMFSTCT
jgi:hypothetical protein